jgi:hypothetical protein
MIIMIASLTLSSPNRSFSVTLILPYSLPDIKAQAVLGLEECRFQDIEEI